MFQWLLSHPKFLGNELYVGGDSYSGITLPIVVKNILEGSFFSQFMSPLLFMLILPTFTVEILS